MAACARVLAVLFGVTVRFVDPTVVSGNGVDLLSIVPILFVGCLSVVDAYILAHVQNAVAQLAVTPGR